MIDRHPTLHVTPRRGWLNDPNGLFEWQGQFHVFHQADEESLWFGRMSWGHVTSTDLVRWSRLPDALSPGQRADRDGCWSGCIVDDGGVPTAVYTGVNALGNDTWHQEVCLATSKDPELRTWVKHPNNPVSVEAPDFPVTPFRDPYVWRVERGWMMLLGSALPSGVGAVLRYRSNDLKAWSYEGVLLSGDVLPAGSLWTGAVWECPAFVPLGEDKHLLLFSVADPSKTPVLHYAVSVVGAFDGTSFTAETVNRFDHGSDCYAPALMRDQAGRVLAFGWAWEGLTEKGRSEQGWAGCLTFPREVRIVEGQPVYRPAYELLQLRGEPWSIEDVPLGDSSPVLSFESTADAIEISLSVDLGTCEEVSVVFGASPNLEEHTRLRVSPTNETVTLDRGQSSLWGEALGGSSTAHYAVSTSGSLDLRILLDGTIAEIFVDDKVVMTDRIYPTLPDSRGVRVSSSGGHATVRTLRVWDLVAPDSAAVHQSV